MKATKLNILKTRILPELNSGNIKKFFGSALALINHGWSNLINIEISESLIEALLEHLVEVFGEVSHELKLDIVKFLTLLRAKYNFDNDSVKCFFADHFFGLPQCLRMSAPSIKRLLLDNQDDQKLLK